MITLTLTTLLAAAPAPVVARVDGTAVTSLQLEQRVQQMRASRSGADPRVVVEDLVNDELLAREGYRLGLDKSPAPAAAHEAERLRRAAERFLQQEVYSTVRVDDAQVKALFHDTGDSVRLKMLVLASEEDARAALARLQKGAKLSDEAGSSMDPAGVAKGGDYGAMTRGQLDGALRELAFSGPLNKPLGPVKLPLGFAVLVVEGRALADEKELPARRAQIVGFAEAQGRVIVKKHIVEQLRAKQKVTVDVAFIKGTSTRVEATKEEADRVVARVGARTVVWRAVLEQLKKSFGGAQGTHVSGPRVKEELVWSEVDRMLLEDAAVAAGYGKEPEALAAAKLAEKNAVIRELANRERAAAQKPDDAALEAFLAARAAEYARPASRSCSHIVAKDEALAKSLAARLEKGERFEELAVEYSADKVTAARGGAIGVVDDAALDVLAKERGEVALAQVLRAAVPGAVSKPVRSAGGWHLVRCGTVTPARAARLDEVRAPLAQRVWFERQQDKVGELIGRLRKGAKIEIDDEAVRRVATALGGQGGGR